MRVIIIVVVVECVLLWATDSTKLRRRHAAFGKSKSDAALRRWSNTAEEDGEELLEVRGSVRAAREETIGTGDGEVVHRKDRSISWNNEEYQERSERR